MGTKINKLRQQTPPNGILLTSWLEKSGFSRSEIYKYMKSEWLHRISETGRFEISHRCRICVGAERLFSLHCDGEADCRCLFSDTTAAAQMVK